MVRILFGSKVIHHHLRFKSFSLVRFYKLRGGAVISENSATKGIYLATWKNTNVKKEKKKKTISKFWQDNQNRNLHSFQHVIFVKETNHQQNRSCWRFDTTLKYANIIENVSLSKENDVILLKRNAWMQLLFILSEVWTHKHVENKVKQVKDSNR